MKAVRKKRGWMYRGALGTVTAIAFSIFAIWTFSVCFLTSLTLPLPAASSVHIISSRGHADIIFSRGAHTPPEFHLFAQQIQPERWDWNYFNWQYFGRTGFTSPLTGLQEKWRVDFCWWLPLLIFSIWPVIHATKNSLYPAYPSGHCHACGYDLRGSPSGVCPECGADVNSSDPVAKAK